jgi:hypothetical protein
MARVLRVIWVRCEAEYFLKWDWTGQISLIRLDKFVFSRLFRLSSFTSHGRLGNALRPLDRLFDRQRRLVVEAVVARRNALPDALQNYGDSAGLHSIDAPRFRSHRIAWPAPSSPVIRTMSLSLAMAARALSSATATMRFIATCWNDARISRSGYRDARQADGFRKGSTHPTRYM